jgi:hypothetical protein
LITQPWGDRHGFYCPFDQVKAPAVHGLPSHRIGRSQSTLIQITIRNWGCNRILCCFGGFSGLISGNRLSPRGFASF